ncbi:MAG TPA: M28 family peptidase [Planctomycetes bacterium]|nr:M28 family peptidase [Planctomycetota bacterium]
MRFLSLFTFCTLASLCSPSFSSGGDSGLVSSPVALERGLIQLDADRIRADLYFLASDEMRGRDTPSPEQRIAARFIAARLERLGWQPGAEDGYLHEYELPIQGLDGLACQVLVESGDERLRFEFARDYACHPSSISTYQVRGEELIYAGGFGKDEIEGLDFKNRWVIAESSGVGFGRLRRIARKGGALGVLVVPGSELSPAAMADRVESWGTRALEGKLNRGRSRRAYPLLYLTADAARKLYDFAGVSDPVAGDVLAVSLQETRASKDDARVGLENVCGLWPGSDPVLRNEVLIISAHYDHVGASDEGEIYNGADDNGSGTCGLLALAEGLVEYGPMRRTVMLIWVSGEEKGLLGSAAWTSDPWFPEGMQPVADINIDMIGRNASDYLLITPTAERAEYNGLVRRAEALAPLEGFPKLGNCDAYWSRSDHANFSRNLHIPVTFLFSDVHEDYHKPSDTPDKIDYDKIRRVARLVLRMLDSLQADELNL